MQIRKGRSEDINALVAFNQAMAEETEGLKLDAATLTRGVTTMINEPQRGFYLVAEQQGNIVASLMVTFEWSDWRAANYYWIQSVYVTPSSRRQGIYRQLYQAVKTMAEAEGGAASFRLYVEHDNQQAQQTYTALGMAQSHYLMFEEVVKA
ncbi:GNAT family N-acetyltransferase [Shewanella yunxiaonensis]|uniref:GNAT family N-acetyltransferase n=1 Tax=Shewanella yunxiaonensis TaxID=2829809 RepID=A0ABX7YUT7_9GAMM|nr:GNAT family N-acetyltransferase [Shewanella yunxiaonensis]QUN06523.1 GNAT family N-acetyltransferase [Shewanella yunxiaonensis]